MTQNFLLTVAVDDSVTACPRCSKSDGIMVFQPAFGRPWPMSCDCGHNWLIEVPASDLSTPTALTVTP